MQKAALFSLLVLSACARGSSPAVPVSTHGPAFAIPEKTVEAFAPIALDTNDGTAMKLAVLEVIVTMHGPIAHTSIYAAFDNPLPRDMEGRFRLVLPPRSSISRLAMKINGGWRESEAAESSVARQTYEMIMHRKRDPLLIEQPREREIAARIAPIFAHERKEVRLDYTSEVGADRPIVVPLRGLPSVGHLEVSIVDGATEPVHIDTHDEQPTTDVRYAVPATVPSTVRSGDFVAMRVKAEVSPEPQPLSQVVYLVDTSASADLEAAIALLDALPKAPVIAYDQTAAYVADLRGRGALGLANLKPALDLAGQSGAKRIVIVGGGGAEGAEIPRSIERIDILGTTATVNARALRELAHHGAVIEDAPLLARSELLNRLSNRVQDAPIAIAGATWQSTSRLLGASPGEERVVYARVPSIVDDVKDHVVDHAVAAAKVESLLATHPLSDANKKDVIRLAHEHRLSTPFTSLIVLENDGDAALMHWSEAQANDPPAPARATVGPVSFKGSHTHAVKPVSVRMGYSVVSGRLPPEIIQRIVRLNIGAFQACYLDGKRRDPHLAGRVAVKFIIQRDGTVGAASDAGSEIKDKVAIDCVVHAFQKLQFPTPEGGIVTVVYPFMFSQDGPTEPRPMAMSPMQRAFWSPFKDAFESKPLPAPWSEAYSQMRQDPSLAPRTPVGFVALGASLEARGDKERAARAYASLAELWPERAELARAAAVRLDHLHAGDPLAIALLRRAVAERPDQPSSHHLLGLTLLRAGDREGARAAFKAGAERRYELRYAGIADLLREDLALVEPNQEPLTRVSLAWETDTSNLDVLVTNTEGERRSLAPLAEASDGYGPEAGNVLPSDEAMRVLVALHRRGMGGDVLGAVHVITRNDQGELSIDPRPFEIMNEHSVMDLGKY